ncbi:MAG: histidinol dehydrogenase [Chlamydiae bacterium RIFCSPHIGHO2_12_FULL_44_59]|nr:MAG: histidinol dehydrogenase [Chlamydiae bacterium RIFCSPHIGHO2_01_FULL_44_39]OGN58599.1 MAG: histidinol dehydrogenase [Chlamydiae bacterium RIFCSPHIGHO2_02_FULL_45_9]OGN61051.1 MAG: histidinol dehydrogenase [Chlamydiae bacterium RIFCSPHIGHO2_12_FULL_44_59]OGN66857.1 MAG: histidinol dehydrogenase [Chlamydiae bacterium RIFCSPLOWO2_01_FULL_44_52]OGN68880.1 MAG: histidinol dehydrogenase [Chlamydiae bacterium RIFCSPLOWO2_12_FULL_45_20]OGN70074.1 MAG: histidinol dehydrogenase [Chlamydiae bacter
MRIVESTDQAALEMLKERKIDFSAIVEAMQPIVREVKKEGDAAIKRWTKQFDKRECLSIAVLEERRQAAKLQVSPTLKEALTIAKENIMKFHWNQLPKEWWVEILPGIQAGQLVRPLERVGCYIPGGRYPLVSTVLMTVLPAIIAGVKEIVVCTPKASLEILFACELCGVDKIFEVGGAMAIAAMAYGTETIPKVDKIVGPGNLYVSAAKKIVYGDVGIDCLAGPSEVVIIADEDANPYYIAADLLAQAEHDVTSMALCITPSRKLGAEVISAVEKRLESLPTKKTAKVALEARGAIILVSSLEEAFAVSNFLAPEHLEIHMEDAISWLKCVENAGSIFLGKYAPEAAGDYASGPNHVIPTGGFAAAQSGLSVKDFIKTPTVQYLSEEGLRLIAPTIIALSEAEGLAGHAESIKVRMKC